MIPSTTNKYLAGQYNLEGIEYNVIYNFKKYGKAEIILQNNSNEIVSAYKLEEDKEYAYKNLTAREVYIEFLKNVKVQRKQLKNGEPKQSAKGVVYSFPITKKEQTGSIDFYNSELDAINIRTTNKTIELHSSVVTAIDFSKKIHYTPLTVTVDKYEDGNAREMRTLDSIGLSKDIRWLEDVNYKVVSDEAELENLFNMLETYTGEIAFDTETTGTQINMFGKIGSKRKAELYRLHSAGKYEDVWADKLVGIIFCIKEKEGYYIPCANRLFANAYGSNSEIRDRLIKKYKEKYTFNPAKVYLDADMQKYWKETPDELISGDVILMERCRDILEKKYIVTHGGKFDWKVCHYYGIDLNICDDTLLLHQVLYQTKGGEHKLSNLKHLTKVEFGIEQLGLADCFVGYKEVDNKGKVSRKATIDFSYMPYELVQAYGPADGDMTLRLYHKYKTDLLDNYANQKYIMYVESKVTSAIGYMEFYGHRINADKIESARDTKIIEQTFIEAEIRKLVNEYKKNTDIVEEEKCINKLKELEPKRQQVASEYARRIDEVEQIKNALKFKKNGTRTVTELDLEKAEQLRDKERENLTQITDKVYSALSEYKTFIAEHNPINLGSPQQKADLLYTDLGIECEGARSVAKKKIDNMLKKLDRESVQYKVVAKLAEWNSITSLLDKFLNQLGSFMYPGGFIFSNYTQCINTGRMSCKQPNAQQYCKEITAIVEPRDNYLMFDADYSQIEYRALSGLAQEKSLIESFQNPDNDYHTIQASTMYGVPYEEVTSKLRKTAKTFNFGIPYGMGIQSLAQQLHGTATPENIADAEEKRKLYFANQPHVERFFNGKKEEAMLKGYTETLWHRRRWYDFSDKKKLSSILRQAGNAVVQGTAADIFKISVARNWEFIRKNKLYGKMLIINMIHDEQLIELDCDTLNIDRVVSEIVRNMQFELKNFPPLYVGGGVERCWKLAKGEGAEMHPNLVQQLIKEHIKEPIMVDKAVDKYEWYKIYHDRVVTFRRDKVLNYIKDSNNWGRKMHPVITSMLLDNFAEGVTKEDGVDYTAKVYDEFTKQNGVDIPYSKFTSESTKNGTSETLEQEQEQEQELDNDEEENEAEMYTEDDEDEEEYTGDEEVVGSVNSVKGNVVKEIGGSKVYGVSSLSLIREYGLIVSKKLNLCGISSTLITKTNIQRLKDYLDEHRVEGSGISVLIVSQNASRELSYKVQGVDIDELEQVLGKVG